MGIYTLRLLIHGILLVGIMYITLDTDDFKLLRVMPLYIYFHSH